MRNSKEVKISKEGAPAQSQGGPSLVSVSCQATRRLAPSPGRTQPGVSPDLFLAPKPLLNSGYKYRSPPRSLAVSMHIPVRWGIQAPTSLQPQSPAGIWASFPTQKKVPVHPSGVHLYSSHRHLLFCAGLCVISRADFPAGTAKAHLFCTLNHLGPSGWHPRAPGLVCDALGNAVDGPHFPHL